jgi:signal transduction histidine kinase/DNA-binding NarL/FixJ family response regulator
MKKIPFHISVGLLSACLLILVFWEFRSSVDEARVNYRNESHNLALGDEAKLVQKLSWMQAALTLVSRDQVVETFVAAGGPLPPMARPRVQPAFELLAENSESVSIYVLSFFSPDEGLLLRVDASNPEKPPENLSPEEKKAMDYLAERYKQGANGFLTSPALAGRQTFFYAWPITHRGRTVGLTALAIRFDEFRSGMSPLVQEISEPASGLIIGFKDTPIGPTENYSETLRAAGDWRIRFSRPDTDFWRRPDVAKARQAALLHTAIIFMGLIAAISLAQRRAARAASQAKSEFLSNISHEVRAPLNGVIGMTDLVLKTTVTPLQREYLKTVSSSAECVLNLVNDLLDLSKVEAGALELDPIDVPLEELFQSAVRWFQERALEKGVQLELQWDDDLPKLIKVDPLRVRQVLTNLVSNAVKFTHEGEVTVKVSRATDELIRVKVRDTGIGISAVQLERIFEPFQQAGGHISRSYGGTGLGLSICQELVKMLGGELKVESELEKGSTFMFTFHAPEVEPDQEPSSESCLNVLVVDDGPINRKLVRSIVEEWGHQVLTCRDGAQALEVLKEDKFDLVLLDLQMPEIDGFEVARTMRARGDRTPIIALTGNALSQDRQRCRAEGMDAHVSKPIDERRLEMAIRQVLPTKGKDTKELDSKGIFDARRSLRRVGGDPRILERVIRLFCERYERHLADLGASQDDPEKIAMAIQSLKNSVAPFAADKISAAIAMSEKGDFESEELEKELRALRDALRDFISEHDS